MFSRCFPVAFFTLLCLGVTATCGLAQSGSTTCTLHSSVHKQALLDTYGRLPLAFVRNEGMVNRQAQFLARSRSFTLFLTPTEAVFAINNLVPGLHGRYTEPGSKQRATGASVLRMRLQRSNRYASVRGVEPLPGKLNYFLGNDPGAWCRNVPTYAKVRYASVYPGIDLVYYGNQRQLEYDFVVAPHANMKQIALSFAGAKNLRIGRSGELSLVLKNGMLRWHRPVVYQTVNGQRRTIGGRYVALGQHSVGFAVGSYDRSLPLVIDPQLVYSTYLSGATSANVYGDSSYGIAVDAQGNAYITGQANTSDFPVTRGAYQTTLKSTHGNAFVAKLNPTGTSLVYCTYLGGAGTSTPGTNSHGDTGFAIAVDSNGNVYVTGHTWSADFPVTPGVFATTRKSKGIHAFVTKISATGASLVYSTYLGGSGGDEAYGIAIDSHGDAFITGTTTSPDFPVTPGVFQTTLKSMNGNAFVTGVNPKGTALIYSTYLGGSASGVAGNDSGNSIAVDNQGNVYVGGYTGSLDFPVTRGAFQTTSHSYFGNAFVTKLNATGSSLVYSTFLGGSGRITSGSGDAAFHIAIDGQGAAYVTGITASSNFPVTNGAFQTTLKTSLDNAFVTKLDPTGSSLVYSTYLGGSGDDSGSGIAVDSHGNASLTGWTSSADFPVTNNAFQTAANNKYADGFVAQLNATGSSLTYSTYLAGTGGNYTGDHPNGIAIDTHGNTYITGQATSLDFPVTKGAFQTVYKGSYANMFITKLFIPAPTYFSVVPNGTGKAGNKVTFTVKLVGSNNGQGIYTEKVTLSVDGSPIGTAQTDGTGTAVLAYTIPKTATIGTHTTLVTFAGDTSYAGCTGTGALTVTK